MTTRIDDDNPYKPTLVSGSGCYSSFPFAAALIGLCGFLIIVVGFGLRLWLLLFLSPYQREWLTWQVQLYRITPIIMWAGLFIAVISLFVAVLFPATGSPNGADDGPHTDHDPHGSDAK